MQIGQNAASNTGSAIQNAGNNLSNISMTQGQNIANIDIGEAAGISKALGSTYNNAAEGQALAALGDFYAGEWEAR